MIPGKLYKTIEKIQTYPIGAENEDWNPRHDYLLNIGDIFMFLKKEVYSESKEIIRNRPTFHSFYIIFKNKIGYFIDREKELEYVVFLIE